uniref:C-type lectin domain-containing protein n=1 Tax=Steinernema glaseri TaxID=37863 RepID=A0A1I7Y1L7_9BILA
MNSSSVFIALLSVSICFGATLVKEPSCVHPAFKYVAGKCLLFVAKPASFAMADKQCAGLYDYPTDLVSIHSEEENAAVKEFVGDRAFWIGAAVDVDGVFFWTDRSPWTFHDLVSQNYPQQDRCIYVRAEQGNWDYNNCSNDRLPYVCEGPVKK